MANVSPHLHFIRLDTDSSYTTLGAADILPGSVIDRVLDGPTHLHFELNMLSDGGVDLVNATGGPSMTDPIIALLGEFSFDGGATVDHRFVLVSCQRSMDPSRPILTIDQYDQSTLYGVSGADHVTYIGTDAGGSTVINAPIALNAAEGAVPRPTGAIGIGSLPSWPHNKGLFQIIPGFSRWAGQSLLQMTPVVDSSLSSLPLSADINAMTTQNTLKMILTRLAGVWQVGDTTAPPGSRAHWVSFSGDDVRNPIGVTQCISLGRVGTVGAVTFDGDTAGTWDETTTARFVGTGLNIDPALAELFAQTSMKGGISDHGIANGQGTTGAAATSITCMVTVYPPATSDLTNWYDNLLIIGTTAGVYYHVVGSGFLVPMSPAMVVNAIAYNNETHKLYIATETGCFSADALPPDFGSGDVAVWTRVGGLTRPLDDLWLDTVGTALVRCGGGKSATGAGIAGVFCYPALSGDTSGAANGYTDWSRIAHSSAIVAAGGNPTDLYYVDGADATKVQYVRPGTTDAPVVCTGITSGQTVIGIDTVMTTTPDTTVHQVVFIRTDAGNAGLYSIVIGATSASAAAAGLSSADGSPVQIRRIVASGVTLFDEYLDSWAATDAGLFRTPTPGGNDWSSPNATSGLGDFDIAMVAGGPAQTVLTHVIARIFTGAERSILVSCDAADTWTDLLASKLDGGPAWYKRAIDWNGGAWPDNTIGALGTLSGSLPPYLSPVGSSDTGGTGSVLPPPDPDTTPGQLPPDVLRARRLDEQQQQTFRIVNLQSPAPQGGMQWGALSEIQANTNIGVITASEQVELVEWRWLSSASTAPRFQIPLQSSFTQDDAALRDLAPTDFAVLSYNPTGWEAVMALSLGLWVVSHSMQIMQGYIRTTTVLGTNLEGGVLDPNVMAAAQADRMNKRIVFGSA